MPDDAAEFFQLRECVEEAFAPLMQWLQRTRNRLAILDEHDGPQRMGPLTERYRHRLIAGAVEAVSPYPVMCASGTGYTVQFHSWRIRLARPGGFEVPSGRGFLNGGMARRVYQATLRALIKYVSELPHPGGASDSLGFSGDRSQALDGWKAERLALILLRCAFEQCLVLNWKDDVVGAPLRQSAFASVISGNTLLRVSCRALVVAAYVGFCWLARQYIANGFLSRAGLVISPQELLVFCRSEVEGVESGVVILPVHTLPASLFPRRARH